jgi:ribosomal protein S18 acetylase RimI-like enzyme
MEKYTIISGGKELIDLTETLWKKLNSLHKSKSTYFPNFFDNFTFEMRKKGLLEKAERGKIKIELVKIANNNIIGYSISTIDNNNNGEIDSIYIDENYRSLKMGKKLMKNAINWLNENNVKSKSICVVFGNDDATEFYKTLGFYPQMLVFGEIE